MLHPAAIAGAVLAVAAAVALPAQYVIVLPSHDVFLVEAVVPLAMGLALAASARPATWWEGPIAGGAMVGAALAGYEAAGAVGAASWRTLAAAAAFVAGASALGAQTARLRHRRLVLVPVTLAVGIAGMALYVALNEPRVGAATSCTTRGRVDYCADPAYAGLVPRWAAAVGPVVDALPGHVRSAPMRVVQTASGRRDLAAIASPHHAWSRRAGTAELALAMDAATWAVGVRRTGTDRHDGRYVTAWWLAARAPGAAAALMTESRSLDGISGSGYATPETGDLEGACWALALLERPRPETAALVRDRWGELVTARPTMEQAARLLGVDAPSRRGPCAPG